MPALKRAWMSGNAAGRDKPEGVLVMPLYESVFIARQDVSAQAVETLADQLTEIITGAGGAVTKRENWGLRALAYRMNKNRKGHYMLFNIDAPAPAVHELERQMNGPEGVANASSWIERLENRVTALEDPGGDKSVQLRVKQLEAALIETKPGQNFVYCQLALKCLI